MISPNGRHIIFLMPCRHASSPLGFKSHTGEHIFRHTFVNKVARPKFDSDQNSACLSRVNAIQISISTIHQFHTGIGMVSGCHSTADSPRRGRVTELQASLQDAEVIRNRPLRGGGNFCNSEVSLQFTVCRKCCKGFPPVFQDFYSSFRYTGI